MTMSSLMAYTFIHLILAVSSNHTSLVEVNLVDLNTDEIFCGCGELLEIFRFN